MHICRNKKIKSRVFGLVTKMAGGINIKMDLIQRTILKSSKDKRFTLIQMAI